MAAYATPDQVRRALVRDLTRTTGSAASLGDDELIQHVVTAQADVDAALSAGGYRVPLTGTVPPLIAQVTAALAAWHADLSYRQGKAPDSELTPVMQRETWARRLLDGWATGRRAIPGLDNSGESPGDVRIGDPVNGYSGRLFPPELPGPAGASWADQEPLYDPDRYRWGADRGWL